MKTIKKLVLALLFLAILSPCGKQNKGKSEIGITTFTPGEWVNLPFPKEEIIGKKPEFICQEKAPLKPKQASSPYLGYILRYKIIEGTCNSTSTGIIVELPELKAYSTTFIWLYYSNPSAQSAEDPKVSLDANSWLEGWQYRIPVTVQENSGIVLSRFQVPVTVDTASLIAAGKMNADCSDIRFTVLDGVTLIPFWIESGCNTANTTIWVKVPQIPANGTTTIYMYYGNPQATSASSRVNTLDWFELGFLNLDANWQSASINIPVQDPIVVAGDPSQNSSDPASIRMQNISSTGFDIRLSEPSCNDDVHVLETVFWLAVDSGSYVTFGEGRRFEAGRIDNTQISANHDGCITGPENFLTVDFTFPIPSPVASSQLQTSASIAGFERWSVTRQRNVATSSFQVAIEDEENSAVNHSQPEDIGWVVMSQGSGTLDGYLIEANSTPDAVDEAWYNINFLNAYPSAPVFLTKMQSYDGHNSSNVRFTNLGAASVQVRIQEEQCCDADTDHTTEIVGYFAFEATGAYPLRKYASPFPTLTLGAEETRASFTPTYIFRCECEEIGSFDGFSRRVPVAIENMTGQDLRDFGVSIQINTAYLISQGLLNSDCSDLRLAYADIPVYPTPITEFFILSRFSIEDGRYNFRIPITIQENSGNNLSEFQVPVTVDTASLIAAGKMNADCSDIRFTASDGKTLIPFWIESGCNTANTTIWVKVPQIPANGTTTIYMYYGLYSLDCPQAVTGPDLVFDFYDDFEDGDISDWYQYGAGSVQIALDGTNYVLLKTGNNDPNGGYSFFNFGAIGDFWAEYKVKRINYNGGPWNRHGIEDSSFNGYGTLFRTDVANSNFGIERRDAGAPTVLGTVDANLADNTWYKVVFYKVGANLTAEIYDLSGMLISSTTVADPNYSTFDRFVVHGGYEYYTDDIIIRKYVSPFPTVTLGAEETPGVGCGSSQTVVWFKIPFAPRSSTTTVFMYYGKKNAPDETYMQPYMFPIAAFGQVSTDHNWLAVSFPTSFTEVPVVIASPMTYNSSQQGVARVRNITTSGFELKFEEYSSLDGVHAVEDFGYVAMAPGQWNLGGIRFEVSRVYCGLSNEAFQLVNFLQAFPETPAILHQLQTYNDTDVTALGAHTRIGDPPSPTNFQIKIEEEQEGAYHGAEICGYIAVEMQTSGAVSYSQVIEQGIMIKAGISADNVDDTFTSVSFPQAFPVAPGLVSKINREDGADNASERLQNVQATGFEAMVEETPAFDGPHTTERFSYIAFQPGGVIYYCEAPGFSGLSSTLGSEERIWWEGWNFRRPVEVQGGSEHYYSRSVSVVIDTASLISQGKMRSDCADIRFFIAW